MTVVQALPRQSRPRLLRHQRRGTYPIATHHHPRWEGIRSGELGIEFVNATHAAFEFRGRLNLAVLRESVRLLVQRHSILASQVVDTPAGARFVFDLDREVDVQAIDLSGTAAENRRALAVHMAGELVWKPFASSTEAWFRIFVISLGASEHVIGFVVHHFICDGWSTAIIQGELLALYVALAAGRRPTPSELPIQYFDYVMSMNDWITSGAADSSATYWRDHLRDAPPTRVPPDFHPAPETAGPLASQSSHLSIEAVARLRDLSRSRGLLMNAIALAALAASVAHLTESRDIVIVSRICGRTQPVLLGLVGAFFDSIALRIRVSMEMTFSAFAGEVQRTLVDSYQHQDYPYQLVKSSLPVIGASDIAPMLNFIDARVVSGHDGRLSRIRPFPLPPAPPSTPTAGRYNGFHTVVRIDEGGLHATTEYLPLLYKEETATRFVRTLCRLLDRASWQPQLKLEPLLEV